MKLIEVFKTKVLKWNPNDSFDIWVSESGEVFDLGVESSHLGYLKETFTRLEYTEQLVNRGWIKITNTSNSVSVCGLNRVLADYKRIWMAPILEKCHKKNVTVHLNIVGKSEAILELPKDQIKFLAIV